MKLWIARDTDSDTFAFYNSKPVAILDRDSVLKNGFRIVWRGDPNPVPFCCLFRLDKIFPELSRIKDGMCELVEFNNDCFRIVKDAQYATLDSKANSYKGVPVLPPEARAQTVQESGS